MWTSARRLSASSRRSNRSASVSRSSSRRTRARVAVCAPRLRLIEPLGYLDFLRLYSGAALVLTDSGGIQEETTALSIPCLTLRENTERPITITHGTNRLVGTDTERIARAAFDALDHPRPSAAPLWDGQ